MAFVCYISLKQVWKIHNPLLAIVREKWKIYLLMCFKSSKRHGIKKWQSTRWRPKIETSFPNNTFYFLYLLTRNIFSRKYKWDGIKKIFIIFEGFFEWQKWNIAIETFKQTSITWKWIIHILCEARNYRYITMYELTRLV